MKVRLLLLVLLILPTFGIFFRSGIHTTHDYHIFRQQQFNLCALEGSLPCRWSPDAGFGYGEPMFNYYGQLPYLLGYGFSLLGFSLIDTNKLLLALSLLVSGFSMYLLARQFWRPHGALLSSIAYVYAPYRAVDVWVRGALPEALSFIFFPLILLLVYRYLTSRRLVYLPFLALTAAGLILTHNLSAFMFAPFAFIWTLFWLVRLRAFHALLHLLLTGLITLCLSAFYLLPVIFENQLVTVNLTTTGYYQFFNHYVSLSQLFISRFWGYGGSTWGPNDTLSFAVGTVHWLAALLVLVWLLFRFFKKTTSVFSLVPGLSLLLALTALFFTHGKSDVVWQSLPLLSFIQFPWRFLGLAALFTSFALGSLPSRLSPILITLLLVLNGLFFRPDIWQFVTDQDLFTGKLGESQLASTVQDYWPAASGALPTSLAPTQPWITHGEGTAHYKYRGAHHQSLVVDITTSSADIVVPQTYFPNWVAHVGAAPLPISSFTPPYHLMTFRLPSGHHELNLSFTNTPIRQLGNWLSIVGLGSLVIWFLTLRKHAA